MAKWKLAAIGCVTVAGLIGTWVAVSALIEPSLSPEFENKLTSAAPAEQRQLIADEAEHLGVTALSVTVIDGTSEPQSQHFGRARDGGLMQMASLSKAVASATVLILAEQRGVGLDADVRGQITSLDIAGLQGGDRPVTLRQLLSHTTGSSQSGYPGYPRDGAVPTTAEVISAPPRFIDPPLAFDGEPGAFRYSGGGYTIAQLWAEDVAGKPFEDIAQELLLTPLGMAKSTFAQPLDETSVAAQTIVGADSGLDVTQGIFAPLSDSWHVYPEKAAAGLWSTTEDYARFVTAMLDAAAEEPSPIPTDIARAMITPEAETDFSPGSFYGLGVLIEPASDEAPLELWHTGANAGYRTIFIARPASSEAARKIVVVAGNTASAAQLNHAVAEVLLEE